MVRGIERIEQDIGSLEEVVQGIGEELTKLYASYIETLGQSQGKQLILAIYHLCTQGYPDDFLKLSLSQKQKLQQNIRKLGKRGDLELKDLLNDNDDEEEEEDEEEDEDKNENENENEDIDENLDLEEISEEQILEITTDGDIKITADLPLTEAEFAAAIDSIAKASENKREEKEQEQDKSSSAKEPGDSPPTQSDKVVLVNASTADRVMELFAAAKTAAAAKYRPKKSTLDTSNPVEIARWQQYLELSIQQVVRVISRDANRTLQKSGILPKKLPPSLLEAAAASSEASAEIMPGPPNLLNLAIEIEPEHKSQGSHSLMKIMAVNLRLGEIEFADTQLLGKRKQIRNVSSRLAKVGREYQKLQRELSVAKAEAAWRSSWYED